MAKQDHTAAEFLPDTRSLDKLREAAAACRGCDLYKNTTQTVFGEGPASARVVMVGEKPGDREDIEGHPFVGPAGRMLSRAIADAGIIERAGVYITNAVKHFKWEARGGRRIHKKPLEPEIRACLPWLEAELEAVCPEVVVCLGATAARAMFGRAVRVRDLRGRFSQTDFARQTLVTIHPSAILRAPDEQSRRAGYEGFTEDLRLVRERMGIG